MSILDTPIAHLDGPATTLGALTAGRPPLAGQRREQVRPHPAVREARAAARAVRRRAASPSSVSVQPVRGPGAGHGRGDRGVLLGDVRRDLPDDREGRGQRRRPSPDLRRARRDAGRDGRAGDVQWNFEKFLIAADGTWSLRFSPMVAPDNARLVDAVDRHLADAGDRCDSPTTPSTGRSPPTRHGAGVAAAAARSSSWPARAGARLAAQLGTADERAGAAAAGPGHRQRQARQREATR